MVLLPTDIPDLTGNIIAGRYVLAEILGTGGFGVVHRATDVENGSHDLAVKCLRKVDNARSKDAIRQIREMALHKVVSSHPNIVTIHEVIDDNKYLYVIMDYCPGGDLFSAITERQVFFGKDELVKSVFLQVLDALQWCHNKRIAHRDIKPENIMCNDDFTHVYLADFGLSSRDFPSNEFSCGSTFYMSPECIGEECGYIPYSPVRSDIWSLGVVLTNMITGRNPWHKAMTDDDCFNAFLCDPDCLPKMLPISEEANLVLQRVFTIDPAARITLRELRKAVLEVNTFFPEEGTFVEPLLVCGDSSLAASTPVLRVVNCRTMECVSSSSSGASSPYGSPYLYPTPDPNMFSFKITPSPAMEYLPIPQLYNSSSSSGSSSESDDEWLVTKSSQLLHPDPLLASAFSKKSRGDLGALCPPENKRILRVASAPGWCSTTWVE